MKTQPKRKRRSTAMLTDLFDTRLDASIVLSDMRERIRLFGSTPLRFARCPIPPNKPASLCCTPD
jgi:hypothetical protein